MDIKLNDNATIGLVVLGGCAVLITMLINFDFGPRMPELNIPKDTTPEVAEQMIKSWEEVTKALVAKQR